MGYQISVIKDFTVAAKAGVAVYKLCKGWNDFPACPVGV